MDGNSQDMAHLPVKPVLIEDELKTSFLDYAM